MQRGRVTQGSAWFSNAKQACEAGQVKPSKVMPSGVLQSRYGPVEWCLDGMVELSQAEQVELGLAVNC